MKRVLYKPPKYATNKNKQIKVSKAQTLYVDNSKDCVTQHGVITKNQLKKTKGIVKTNKGTKYYIFLPSFADQLARITRKAQIITPKDAATILARTGITKKSLVVDAGTGSGGLACFLAPHAKHIYSYDTDQEAISLARNNAKNLQIKNITVSKHDITQSLPKKNVDVIILDLLDAERAITTALSSLKVGGYLVAYTPSITQALSFVNKAAQHDNLLFLNTIETVERSWKITGKILRPHTEGFGHSAFLTFLRNIQ